MCLVINNIFHDEKMSYRNYTKLPKPYITQKDIHCLKILERSSEQSRNERLLFDNGVVTLEQLRYEWFTPFTKNHVLFNNGVATLECNDKKKKIPLGINYYRYGKMYLVYEGVHCLYNNKPNDYYNKYCFVFDAIIPKGTMIYFGMGNDIVCGRLNVFAYNDDYLEYSKNNDVFDIVAYNGSSFNLAQILKDKNLVRFL